jgi:hypothetical protein
MLLVVTPVGTITVHVTSAGIVEPEAVKLKLDAPGVAVKVVLAHPDLVNPEIFADMENVGNVNIIVSSATSGVLSVNE